MLRVTGMLNGGVACLFCNAALVPPFADMEPEDHRIECEVLEAMMKKQAWWADDIGEVCSEGEVNAVLAAWLAANGRSGQTDESADAIMRSAQYADELTDERMPKTVSEYEAMVGFAAMPRTAEGELVLL